MTNRDAPEVTRSGEMRHFDPTHAPSGRLARLGVLIDPNGGLAPVMARFCDRAGINIVWLGRMPMDTPAADRDDPSESDVAEMVATVTRARIGRLIEPGAVAGHETLDEAWYADAADLGQPSRSIRTSATADSLRDIPALLELVDDLVLPAWRFPDLETAADEARAEAVETGRDPESLGIAAVVPVSIGRTDAEASARADTDPVFRDIGHPRDIGIFGTLEECQDRVIALAHAGITDLRCILPGAPDIHDVIAQLTAITMGTTDVLVPGSLRSPAPPPPDGWGGRPDVPPQPRISGGSRRR
jgi:hypothetical protein